MLISFWNVLIMGRDQLTLRILCHLLITTFLPFFFSMSFLHSIFLLFFNLPFYLLIFIFIFKYIGIFKFWSLIFLFCFPVLPHSLLFLSCFDLYFNFFIFLNFFPICFEMLKRPSSPSPPPALFLFVFFFFFKQWYQWKQSQSSGLHVIGTTRHRDSNSEFRCRNCQGVPPRVPTRDRSPGAEQGV